jgi:DNA-binding NarL/FixJ family response regulator
MSIRMLLADDHAIVRTGFYAMLNGTDVDLAYQVASGEEAVRCAVSCQPDVVLLDLRMPGMDGLEALEQIKRECPQISVLLTSAVENVEDLAKGHQLGASGFVSKSVSRPELLKAIRRAAAAKNAWPRSLLRRVRLMTPAREGSVLGGVWITARQREVLTLLAAGQSNEEIAEELGVSVETVRQHMKHLLGKTGSEDRTQAALWAIRYGLAGSAAADSP